MKISKKLLLITNIISIVLFIFFLIYFNNAHTTSRSLIVRDYNNHYNYTNPILDCGLNEENNNESAIPIDKTKDTVEELRLKYNIKYVSVYYRDLNNGPWLGINEKEYFSPASLLKVPVLIGFLKEVESNPLLPFKKILVNKEDMNTIFQNIKPRNGLKEGGQYNLDEVANIMIKQSDNTALNIMKKEVDYNYVANLISTLGIEYKGDESNVKIRVKDYAGFFRVLFNSSYLSRDMSEKALDILAHAENKDGLVAGVPSGVVVAHKFGEHKISGLSNSADDAENNIQLHDCGIIYYPDSPYILCIMTRGDNINNEQSLISSISRYFYDQVKKSKEHK